VDNGAGGTEGFVKIMRDETDRKLAEEKLRAATAAAEEAQAAAVDAGRTKDEFISAVSHELRTPLSTIRLWARMLRNENLSAKDRDDGAQMIERAAVAQQRIVDDLFEVSRIASGQLRLTLQETDLADVIRTAMKAVEPELIGREIHLSSAIGPDIGIVLADPHRIRQVLGYMLKSTTKLIPAGGEVRVAAKRLGDSIYVVVSDGGTDIRDELLAHDPQVDAGGNPHGSDLGLLMARQIVDLHGGKISASAGEGEHAAFTMRLRAHRSTVRKTRD
jgi:signal transduction histidine kinase